MGYMPELDHSTLDELFARFRGPCPEGDEHATLYYEEIAWRIQQRHCRAGLDFLLAERTNVEADEDRLRGVLLGISTPELDGPELRSILRGYLNDARPLIVMDAIDSLAYLGVSEIRPRMLALSGHPSPHVRGGVLRYLAQLFPEEAMPLLLAGLHDDHFIVRESAVDALDEMKTLDEAGVARALMAIRPLLADAHPHVRQAAEAAVEHFQEELQDGEGKVGGEE